MGVADRPDPSSERSALSAAAAWILLTALVLGAPLLLASQIGWPLAGFAVPHAGPHDPWTAHSAARVAELLIWFLWAQFTACVAVEIRVVRTGVAAPARVPGAAPSRALARTLVTVAFAAATAAVLQQSAMARPLAATSVSVTAHFDSASMIQTSPHQAASGQAAPNPRTKYASTALHAPAQQSGTATVDRPAPAAGPETATAASDGALSTVLPMSTTSVKYYVVAPPAGRNFDSLWEIAQRYLGDGRRYREIFALNDGRMQPDGGELNRANLIRPGWILALPGDAQGPGLSSTAPADLLPTDPIAPTSTSAPIPPTSTSAPIPPTSTSAPIPPTSTVPVVAPVLAAPKSPVPEPAAPKPAEPAVTDPVSHIVLPVHHQPAPPPAKTLPHPVASRTATANPRPAPVLQEADGSVVSSIGHVLPYVALIGSPVLAAALLTALGAATRRQRRDRPAAVFAAPPEPPVAEVGRTIRAAAAGEAVDFLDRSLRVLRAGSQASGRAVPPIRLARVDPHGVQLALGQTDLAAPPPWTALAGGTVWRWDDFDALAAAPERTPVPCPLLWCVGSLGDEQIFVNLEAGEGRRTLVNGPARSRRALLAAAAASLAAAPWADQVKIEAVGLPAELALIAPQRLRIHPDVDTALTVLEREDAATTPHLVRLLIAEPVDPVDLARINALTAGENGATALLGTSHQEEGVPAITADAVGRVRIPGVYGELTASRLSDPLAGALGSLFLAAAAPRYVPTARPADAAPLGGRELLDQPVGIRAALLGPVEISGVAPADAARGPLFTEALVLLLFHRAGLTASVVARALWPRGITPAARDRMLRDLRDWLGSGPDGPRLTIEPSGLVRLSADVRSDWDEFQGAYRDADLLPPERADDAIAGLRRALGLVRGELLGDRPPGRYSWLGFGTQDTEVPAVIADAACRVGERALQTGAAADALWAADQGLLGSPDDERLNQLKIRALGALGDREVLLAAVADLKVRTWFRYGEAELPTATNEVIAELTAGLSR
jgi:hypothetical protein